MVFDEAENQLKKQKTVVCRRINLQNSKVGIGTLSRVQSRTESGHHSAVKVEISRFLQLMADLNTFLSEAMRIQVYKKEAR